MKPKFMSIILFLILGISLGFSTTTYNNFTLNDSSSSVTFNTPTDIATINLSSGAIFLFDVNLGACFLDYTISSSSLLISSLTCPSDNFTNTYGVDDPNLENVYEAYLDSKTDRLKTKQQFSTLVLLIVNLLSLLIIVILFFRKKDGILQAIRGDGKVNLGVLILFMSMLTIFLSSLITLSIVMDITYFLDASIDKILWTDDLKFVNQ